MFTVLGSVLAFSVNYTLILNKSTLRDSCEGRCSYAAQHLLSAVADEVAGADTAGWELRLTSPDGAADAVLVELETDALTSEQVRPRVRTMTVRVGIKCP